MDKQLLYKMLAIGLMALLLLILQTIVESQIRDRMQQQRTSRRGRCLAGCQPASDKMPGFTVS